MTVSGVSGANSPLAQYMTQPTSPQDSTKLDSNAFLKLLVAQLKYQDPSKPTDSTEMMAQSAQFSMVQRLEDMATSSASSLKLQQGMAASNLVGQSISWLDTDGTTRTGTVSSASFGGATSGEPVLKVGGTAGTQSVQLSQVTAVNRAG